MHRKSRRPGARAARLSYVAAPAVGLVLAGGLVWQSSYSAFSATTNNGANNWATGSVALSDNDSNIALFNVTNARPNDSGSRCIVVTSSGTLASTVKLYGSGLASTNSLGGQITLVVTQGTGTAANCTDFAPLGTGSGVYNGLFSGFTATNFAGGYGTWAPTGSGSETRTFKFDWSLSNTAPNSTQSSTAGVTFVWEAQNS